ncbi:hypothetical protein MMC09_000925 [Bachmanniomyces sp. S44760]|nr:hypothetical protein [Bachmanniomyces sp. S44760]
MPPTITTASNTSNSSPSIVSATQSSASLPVSKTLPSSPPNQLGALPMTSQSSASSPATTLTPALSAGAIAGIVVGGVFALGVVLIALFALWRYYGRRTVAAGEKPVELPVHASPAEIGGQGREYHEFDAAERIPEAFGGSPPNYPEKQRLGLGAPLLPPK